jgi:hypothetical protein
MDKRLALRMTFPVPADAPRRLTAHARLDAATFRLGSLRHAVGVMSARTRYGAQLRERIRLSEMQAEAGAALARSSSLERIKSCDTAPGASV